MNNSQNHTCLIWWTMNPGPAVMGLICHTSHLCTIFLTNILILCPCVPIIWGPFFSHRFQMEETSKTHEKRPNLYMITIQSCNFSKIPLVLISNSIVLITYFLFFGVFRAHKCLCCWILPKKAYHGHQPPPPHTHSRIRKNIHTCVGPLLHA